MKKILVLLMLLPLIAFSQNNYGSANDQDRIALTVIIPPGVDGIPEHARSLLQNKLDQVASQNGLGGISGSPRFALTAKMSVMTKDITPTQPPMEAYTYGIYLYIVDIVEQTIVSSTSITTKGAGTNANKAYTNGLKPINLNNTEIKNFMQDGKRKIIEYYNSKCDFIISRAKSLASQNQFGQSLALLSSVPDVCKDCFMKCMDEIGPIYQDYINHDCEAYVNIASGLFAANPNTTGAVDATAVLSLIDPDSDCFKKSGTLISKIEKKMREDEKRDWKFMERVWGDNVKLEAMRIKAYRDVGVAFGQGQQPTYQSVLWVF
ncbi:MAG: hypothetical protein CVU00_00240 [Bacteroidetes bacterium HGW-Bacteroidetes-17]|jgi:hypothetical protein|nr:MAG: hypothetical protein CVU00_00240 [Bacteroidetes bacterium HGW-Bacteroidetes-17]